MIQKYFKPLATGTTHSFLTDVKSKEREINKAYILVVDTFHEHQLSVGPFCVSLILKGSTQLLDGDISLQVVVIR